MKQMAINSRMTASIKTPPPAVAPMITARCREGNDEDVANEVTLVGVPIERDDVVLGCADGGEEEDTEVVIDAKLVSCWVFPNVVTCRLELLGVLVQTCVGVDLRCSSPWAELAPPSDEGSSDSELHTDEISGAFHGLGDGFYMPVN